jgi:hypothetical protein
MRAYPKTGVRLDRVRPRSGQKTVLPDYDLVRVSLLNLALKAEIATFNGRHFLSGFSLLSPLCGGHSKPTVVDVRVAWSVSAAEKLDRYLFISAVPPHGPVPLVAVRFQARVLKLIPDKQVFQVRVARL